MNSNTYTTSNLAQQHTHQNAQHQQQQTTIAYLPAHAHMQQQQQQLQHHHHQLQRQLNQVPSGDLASSSTATYFDARTLDKTFANNFSNTATNRYFTNAAQTTLPASLANPHNTILITNNFSQPALSTNANLATVSPQTITTHNFNHNINNNNSNNNNNMRILSAASAISNNKNNKAQSCGIYNLSGDIHKDTTTTENVTLSPTQLQHLFQQTQAQQHQQHHHHQNALTQFATQQQLQQHFVNFAAQQQQQQTPLTVHFGIPPSANTTATQYFMHHSEADTNKLLQPLVVPTTATTPIATNNTKVERPISTLSTNANNSTVVLDRINICINNHYNDAISNNNTTSTANTSDYVVSNVPLPILSCSTTTNTTKTTGEAQEDNIVAVAEAVEEQEQQPPERSSPIIPIIKHNKSLNTLHRTNNAKIIACGQKMFMKNNINNNYKNDKITTTIHIVDEPDSTTTPHTPPTTPDNNINIMEKLNNNNNNNNSDTLSSPLEQSPSTTTTTNIFNIENIDDNTIKNSTTDATTTTIIVIDADDNDNEHEHEEEEEVLVEEEEEQQTTRNILTPPMPATTITTKIPQTIAFKIGEDVLLKRHDNRFYLGTVIDSAGQLFLVRFDDKSEQWCMTEEMRKLGGGSSGDGSTTNDNNNSNSDINSMQTNEKVQTQMCLACKRPQPNDIVECCERCGRGYHRGCTTEVYAGSGDWLCKRCVKPMKVKANCVEYGQEETKVMVCRQLPYHADNLNWDEKHRVNEEQIYCYCGKTGKFDYNMLQCCKCRNWFHTHCMQDFKSRILRGDSFFVFCCTVCNDGEEFLRRLQIDWVDVLHLTLYNLSAMKKHQHHKYHHLLKDIWPYVLEKRHIMPIPCEWKKLAESIFMDNIKNTLKVHTDRFICGREIKRDHYYYALRHNGPPILPKFYVHVDDHLNDEFIIQKLQLNLLPDAPENIHLLPKLNLNDNDIKSKLKEDIYEFRIEDDEKFTSEDDVPIKVILEKVKRKKSLCELKNNNNNNINSSCSISSTQATSTEIITTVENADVNNETQLSKLNLDSNIVPHVNVEHANDVVSPIIEENKNKTTPLDIEIELEKVTTLRNSRKRKAFTLSKSYKETASEVASKRFFMTGDSSSDENSSSSRGTSLDIIIPPPKNFLGPNNPFRMITPKKNVNNVNGGIGGVSSNGGRAVKNSIFNTSGLNLSSKLAALKSAGFFQNLCTSNLAKAAGQPRTVRTIKRRLSAKDIMIGPNQEVRRRRTRRSSANIEVISTTTINPITTNLFPLYAKEQPSSVITQKSQTQCGASLSPPALSAGSSSSSLDSGEQIQRPTHGRLLRQRPQKQSPNNSRRGSMSSASSSSNQSLANDAHQNKNDNNNIKNSSSNNNNNNDDDLKQSVNKYFGIVNRFESGEQYSIRARRRLPCGLMQYLIEWGSE